MSTSKQIREQTYQSSLSCEKGQEADSKRHDQHRSLQQNVCENSKKTFRKKMAQPGNHWLSVAAYKQLPSAARNLSLSKKIPSPHHRFPSKISLRVKNYESLDFQSAKQLTYPPGFHGQRGSNSSSEPPW